MHPRLTRASLRAWRLSSRGLDERIEAATLCLLRERDATSEQYRQSEYILGCYEASRSYRRRFGKTLGRKLEEVVVGGPNCVIHAIVNDWEAAWFALELQPSTDGISEEVRKSFAVAMDELSADPARRPVQPPTDRERLEVLLARKNARREAGRPNPPGPPPSARHPSATDSDEELRRAMLAAGLTEAEVEAALSEAP